MATNAEEMMARRKGPKQAIFDKEAAKETAGKISRELSNYFRFETLTKKRLQIEDQAEETGKMKSMDPMPKLDIQMPPAPVSGGESSVAPDPRRKKKKPGKPDAALVPSRRTSRFDKAELRKRIIEAQKRRRNRVIQGIIVPPSGAIHGEPVGQLPYKYRGLVADCFL